MYVNIKVHGGSYFNEFGGELLLITHGVESFFDGKESVYMQVPAMVIRCRSEIMTVNLQGYLKDVQVEIIDDNKINKTINDPNFKLDI